jgi:predicted PurR-regulated permease PerM
LVLAGLIAIVDAFPILGVGTVLIPWALICLLRRQTVRGIGLLAVYAVVWLARSILEPKLVGKGLGLDPLVTLVAIYAGWKLWGIGGMLLAPILALTVAQVLTQWRVES